MRAAKSGQITREMKIVAEDEGVSVEAVRRGVADGRIVITCNVRRSNIHPIGIGEGLRTKVNANVGTSPDLCNPDLEVEKAKVAAVSYTHLTLPTTERV